MALVPDFQACEAKLSRAREHRLALAGDLDAFFSHESPLSHRVSFDNGQSAFLVHATLDHDSAYRWATVVGDVLHNLRSALDYLVHQLVITAGGRPARNHQFPICDDARNFEREVGERERLDGLDDEAKNYIREVQPFSWAERHPGAPAGLQALAQLRDLSNRDKHKLLLPVRLLAREFEVNVDMVDAERIDTWTTDESIGDGDLLMSVTVRKTGPNPAWEPRLRLGGYLALDAKGLPAHDEPVMDVLEMLEGGVATVLNSFRPRFER